MAAPLGSKPVFDLGALAEHATLEQEKRPTEAGLKIGNQGSDHRWPL